MHLTLYTIRFMGENIFIIFSIFSDICYFVQKDMKNKIGILENDIYIFAIVNGFFLLVHSIWHGLEGSRWSERYLYLNEAIEYWMGIPISTRYLSFVLCNPVWHTCVLSSNSTRKRPNMCKPPKYVHCNLKLFTMGKIFIIFLYFRIFAIFYKNIWKIKYWHFRKRFIPISPVVNSVIVLWGKYSSFFLYFPDICAIFYKDMKNKILVF